MAGQEQSARRAPGRRQGHRDCDRSNAAHHARAEDGRAVVDGQHRRLSRGHRSGELLRPILHRTDDRRRASAAGQGARDRRRRRRAGGNRRCARTGRDRPRVRHASRRQGPGQEHGRRVPRAPRRRRGRRRRRLWQGDEPRVHQGRDGALRRASARRRHHHHDRAHSQSARTRS